jgi:hypothetical protein
MNGFGSARAALRWSPNRTVACPGGREASLTPRPQVFDEVVKLVIGQALDVGGGADGGGGRAGAGRFLPPAVRPVGGDPVLHELLGGGPAGRLVLRPELAAEDVDGLGGGLGGQPAGGGGEELPPPGRVLDRPPADRVPGAADLGGDGGPGGPAGPEFGGGGDQVVGRGQAGHKGVPRGEANVPCDVRS